MSALARLQTYIAGAPKVFNKEIIKTITLTTYHFEIKVSVKTNIEKGCKSKYKFR
jgi:hypothetical protein